MSAVAALLLAAALPVESWRLADGTTVALVEDHRAPRVELHLEFAAGTGSRWGRRVAVRDAFELQLHDPQGTLRARADRIAAGLALSVGTRTATLRASCLTSDLDALLALVEDVLANRELDRGELARRRQAERLAWRLQLRDPWFRASRALARALLEEGDARRAPFEPPRAPRRSVRQLVEARDVLVRLPGRVIGLAGDLTREQAERVARSLLPRVVPPDDPTELELVLEPVRRAESPRRPETIPRLTQVTIAMARLGVPYDHPDRPAFLIADHVLGGHFYSRLSVALRHETGHTYHAGTRAWDSSLPAPYVLLTSTAIANAAEAERTMGETLRRFREQGLTEQERRDAMGFLEGRLPFGRQAPAQVLERWRLENRLGLPPGAIDAAVARAGALRLEEVNSFIGRFYDPDQFVTARVTPP